MANKQRSALAALLITAGVIGVIIAGSVFAVKHLGLHFNLSRLFSHPQMQTPRAPLEDLPVARGPDETIEVGRMLELRQWLVEEKFEALNSALDRYQKAFETDYTSEFALDDAYQSFSVTMPAYEVLFDKWIRAHPDQYQPYLAAAHYYYARGWESRGFKWRKDTSDEQIRGMRLNFSSAEEKLTEALKIKPDLMLAYHIRIGIHNAQGEDQAERQAIEKAIHLFPYSFDIRSTAMWANEPRWGGSYRRMWTIANDAEPYAREYPTLTALYGAAFLDQARVYERAKAYDKALESLNKAISYGDRYDYFRQRAELYAFELKDHTQALEDINYAISLRPTACSNYLVRAKICFALEDYDTAMEDLNTISAIRPGDPSTGKWCLWASRKLNSQGHQLFKTDLESAIEFYDLSLSFKGNNPETHYWRGVAHYKLEHYDAAAIDFKDCIEIDPHYFEAYRMLDYTLAREGQWETIIRYWDAFLELEVDHAEAYFERSGAHYHNKNIRQAKADLIKACDLGNQKACQQYQKVKNRI